MYFGSCMCQFSGHCLQSRKYPTDWKYPTDSKFKRECSHAMKSPWTSWVHCVRVLCTNNPVRLYGSLDVVLCTNSPVYGSLDVAQSFVAMESLLSCLPALRRALCEISLGIDHTKVTGGVYQNQLTCIMYCVRVLADCLDVAQLAEHQVCLPALCAKLQLTTSTN